MNGIEGQILRTESGRECRVEKLLGSGGQGEVYRVIVNNQPMALKWYYPNYIKGDPHLKERLENAIKKGPPNDRFLWPMEMVYDPKGKTFGYIMPLREPRFKGIADLMKGHINPTFRSLCTVGYELADSFLQLHAKGLCYSDISYGNVFIDPDTGEVRICDNDNVVVTGTDTVGVLGTPRFMAPEIVRGEARPSVETDLFSLAVLLFYIFFMHHPLEGEKEAKIHCFDIPAMNKLYGYEPVFIYDPNDSSNRPVRGIHDNAIIYWEGEIYPKFFYDLFTRAFTEGLHDPKKRVRESEWRKAFVRLRDSIIYCQICGAQNFYDTEKLRANRNHICWYCNTVIHLPPRIKIENIVVVLNYDTKLYPYHLDDTVYDFSKPIAEVVRHPTQKNVWGLKNLTNENWYVTKPDGTILEVQPNRSITISLGIKINFGKANGEINI